MPLTQVLERPAVVLGQTVAVLDDLEPGAEASVDVAVQSGQFAPEPVGQGRRPDASETKGP